jgi:hypothetical protein
MAERTKASAEQVIREVESLYEQADQAPPEVLSNLAPAVHQHEQQLKQQQQQKTAAAAKATTFIDTTKAHHTGLSFWGLRFFSLGRAYRITCICINLSGKA